VKSLLSFISKDMLRISAIYFEENFLFFLRQAYLIRRSGKTKKESRAKTLLSFISKDMDEIMQALRST